MHFGTSIHLEDDIWESLKSCIIMVHIGKTIFGIFEILNNLGIPTTLQLNIHPGRRPKGPSWLSQPLISPWMPSIKRIMQLMNRKMQLITTNVINCSENAIDNQWMPSMNRLMQWINRLMHLLTNKSKEKQNMLWLTPFLAPLNFHKMVRRAIVDLMKENKDSAVGPIPIKTGNDVPCLSRDYQSLHRQK